MREAEIFASSGWTRKISFSPSQSFYFPKVGGKHIQAGLTDLMANQIQLSDRTIRSLKWPIFWSTLQSYQWNVLPFALIHNVPCTHKLCSESEIAALRSLSGRGKLFLAFAKWNSSLLTRLSRFPRSFLSTSPCAVPGEPSQAALSNFLVSGFLHMQIRAAGDHPKCLQGDHTVCASSCWAAHQVSL